MNELWAHQTEAIKKAALLKGYALFFEMGTGKTRTCLEMLRFQFNSVGRIKRTIIFCPPLAINNWVNEWLKYTKIDPKRVIPLYGSGKNRLVNFQNLTRPFADTITGVQRSEPYIFVTNYESLQMDDLFEAFRHWQPESLVFDESHKLKNPKAQRSKLSDELANPWDKKLKRALPKPNVYILTGSPILNSPMDIFQQFKIMDGGRSFGSNFFAFRGRYFRDRNAAMPKDRYFPDWQIMTKEKDNFDALGEITRLIFEQGMRVTKEECLDLPPEVSVTIKCGMTKEQERLYKEMKTDYVTYIESKAVVASLAITKALRLMQIASGFVATEVDDLGEPRQIIELKNTPKYEKLKELLEEIIEQEQKVLIWCVFKHNYKIVARACEEVKAKLKSQFTWVEAHGEISSSKMRDNVETFQKDPNCRVFIGHPESAGISINLVQAKYSIFYSRNFSLEHFLQARSRNHRGGAEIHDKITHYDLVCENTIEEIISKKLINKEDLGNKILTDIIKGH